MGAPAADGQTLRELCACAAAAACALSLTLGCSHSRGNRDANADQGSRSEDDVPAPPPDLLFDIDPQPFDSAMAYGFDATVAGPEPDASAPPWDLAEEVEGDGPERALATCSSYGQVGPAKAVAKPVSPAARVGNRYAVLATPSTKPGWYYGDVSFYDVVFSWFDPETNSFSGSVTAFRFRGVSDGGMPIDFGSAVPVAIIEAPNGFAVLWQVYRQSKYSLYVALLDSTGAGISQPVMLGANVSLAGDIVWDGSQFAVSWIEWSGPLRLSRIDREGNLLGTVDVVSKVDFGPLRLLWDGNAYGMFWENSMPTYDEVWFARVDRAGAILLEPRQLTPPDCYAGNLLVEPVADGYLTYWTERPMSGPWFVQSGLHRLDRNGQDLAPARELDSQSCALSTMATSGADIGVTCANQNALGFAGLGPYESTQLTPVLSLGLPVPGKEGISGASARAVYGKDDGFDVFWMGSLDGATWGNYLTQVRCTEP